jgi:hypothetical protein
MRIRGTRLGQARAIQLCALSRLNSAKNKCRRNVYVTGLSNEAKARSLQI